MPFFQVDGSKIANEETVIERDILGTLRHIFENRLFNVGKTEITLLTIIELIIFIIVFLLISRLVRRFLKKRILPHLKLTDSAQFVILRLTHYIMILAGIAFGDYGLNLELSVWIAQPDPKIRTKTISDLNYAIEKSLKENGITVPFQQFSTYQ